MVAVAIHEEKIRQIAAHHFGDRIQITASRCICPEKRHGIVRVPESTRHLLYRVELAGDAPPLIFRFSRHGDDVFDREVRNYERLARQTGVRVPRVFAVDRSRRLVPTSYMILECLEGDNWRYLAHPDNPETGAAVKADIERQVGHFFARAHDVEREVRTGPAAVQTEAQTVSFTLDRLEAAIRQGVVDVDLKQLERCRRTVAHEPAFHSDRLSLCLADAEFHFAPCGPRWKLAFVCDVEWIEYRHPYADLVSMLGGNTPLWSLTRPLEAEDVQRAAASPFFQGYTSVRTVDFGELHRLSAYYQLGTWAYLAAEDSPPEKKAWVRSRAPLIRALVDRIAARTAHTAASPPPLRRVHGRQRFIQTAYLRSPRSDRDDTDRG